MKQLRKRKEKGKEERQGEVKGVSMSFAAFIKYLQFSFHRFVSLFLFLRKSEIKFQAA